MSKDIPRKHHFAPQFFLKSWGDEKGKFLCYRKINNRIDPASTKNIAYQNDLYKFKTEIESSFITPFIDSRFASVVKKAQEIPLQDLTENEKIGVIRFLMTLHLRNPDEMEKIVENIQHQDNDGSNIKEVKNILEAFHENVLKEMSNVLGEADYKEYEVGYRKGMVHFVGLLMKEIGFSEQDLEKIKDSRKDLYCEIYRATKFMSLESYTDELFSMMKSNDLHWVEINVGDNLFITSDVPVIFSDRVKKINSSEGCRTLLCNISPTKSYLLTGDKDLRNLIEKTSCDLEKSRFLNNWYLKHSGTAFYAHQSSRATFEECIKTKLDECELNQ